jgi:hypothetical protein
MEGQQAAADEIMPNEAPQASPAAASQPEVPPEDMNLKSEKTELQISVTSPGEHAMLHVSSSGADACSVSKGETIWIEGQERKGRITRSPTSSTETLAITFQTNTKVMFYKDQWVFNVSTYPKTFTNTSQPIDVLLVKPGDLGNSAAC